MSEEVDSSWEKWI